MSRLGDRYELGDVVAVEWNTFLRAQFPHADHTRCRQEMFADHDTGRWVPFHPPRCVDWHCPRCGKPCNGFGHHTCEAQ